jgi:glycosyltransferase involved in cell wall biosynthesis
MARHRAMGLEIHLFEPTGYGGVFQHTCQLAMTLSRHGRPVVLHTSREHEQVRLQGVVLCTCSRWPRNGGETRWRAAVRRAAIALALLRNTLPHLVRTVPAGAVLHVEGVAASGVINVATMAAARRAGLRVVYSPHDTFSRRGRVEAMLLRAAYRLPHAVVVYSHADERRLRNLAVPVHLSPLTQLVPMPSPADRLKWRREWRVNEAEDVVLFAGFVRPEKRLDLLIRSASRWPSGRRLAVVGPDRGGWAQCDQFARSLGVPVRTRLQFVELDEFTAAVAAADLVVVPSEQASQSGVLAVARRLRTPTIAADVGGMAELSSRTFTSGDSDDLTRAIEAELSRRDRPCSVRHQQTDQDEEALLVHLRAYGEKV